MKSYCLLKHLKIGPYGPELIWHLGKEHTKLNLVLVAKGT